MPAGAAQLDAAQQEEEEEASSSSTPAGQASSSGTQARQTIMKPRLGMLLAFADPSRESQYQLFYAQKRFYFDCIGLYASMLQLAPGTLVVLSQGKSSCTWLLLVSWLLHSVHGWLMASHSVLYIKHRTTIVAALLVVGRGFTATLIPGCSADSTTTMKLCYKTGIIPLVWYSIILPLPFCLQVAAQLAAIALYQGCLVLSGCSMLISDPPMLLLVHNLWVCCRKAVSVLLMLQGITGDAELASWAAGDAVTSASRPGGGMSACYHSVTLLQLLFGLLLPLPVWYMLEVT